jgi:hypothetical protein
MSREFIARSTKLLHFPVRFGTSASSHRDLSLAAFTTNIAESDFRYTQLNFKPMPRLEQIGDKCSKQVDDRKHRTG